jgi:6-phosphofructokinase 1
VHRSGGSLLGSSRGGGERTETIVDAMEQLNLTMLFTIGGDGTQRGALKLADEIAKRNNRMAVVGVPKTIDNDLSYVERSFGFETAVSRAVESVASAHAEARGAIDGIGIVRVMGRESGFIAAHTALATNDVNFVLVPEVPFDMEGDNGFLAHLERRLTDRHHAVVLVAEGAGQQLVSKDGHDASGNKKLGDIGIYLRDRIASYFEGKDREVSIKYIDPSYLIRAAPANPTDAIYCARLGANAVHAAMAGRTGCLVGLVNHRLVHVPIELATGHRNRVDPESPLWRDVLETTGQKRMVNSPGSA